MPSKADCRMKASFLAGAAGGLVAGVVLLAGVGGYVWLAWRGRP